MAGEFLAKTLGEKGNVVELVGIPGTSAAAIEARDSTTPLQLSRASRSLLPRRRISAATGVKVFENILQAQPDIAGVFAHNDEMILGAIAAAEARAEGHRLRRLRRGGTMPWRR